MKKLIKIKKNKRFNNYLNFGWSCFEGSYRLYDKHYTDVNKSKKLCLENITNYSNNTRPPILISK